MTFFTLRKIEKLYVEIKAAVFRESLDIPMFKFMEGDCEGAQAPDFDDASWEDFSVGSLWGGYDIWAWFRARIQIPAGWENERLYLYFLAGPRDDGESTAEALLYVNGQPIQGIDVWHPDAWLSPAVLQHGEIQVALRAWSGVLNVPARRHFKQAQLIRVDPHAEQLAYITDTLVRTLKGMSETDLRRVQMLDTLNQAYLMIDFSKPGSEQFYESIAASHDFLKKEMARWAERDEVKPVVVGIGHAHIDMAWLWRLAHTRQKAARTFSTALHLMDQYPEYRFLHSSPQLYKFLQQDHPEIFARVKEYIQKGRWEITGATWVEPDTNVPSGESLVRQFLFGRRYVRDTFGFEMNLLWLPDVFGYSAALPQIIKKSGISYFMTTKISWSQFNRFPNDTFRWRGLDGSEVLTHFITTPEENSSFYTYNGQMRPEDIKGIWETYRQKDVNNELLLSFGWGDGGGGPTREMLEWSAHQKNLPGQPRVELGKAEDYFERLNARLQDKSLPVWDGELYLEYHRGTYTSQAQVKRANRKSEILYHNAEWLAALADLLNGTADYPVEAFNAGWEKILLLQFHDILPGSSIHSVYEDAAVDYAEITGIGERVVKQAINALSKRLAAEHDQVVLFNSLAWPRHDLAMIALTPEMRGKTVCLADGTALPAQVVETPARTCLLVAPKAVTPMGYSTFACIPAQQAESQIKITAECIITPYYHIRINENGQIISLFDRKQEREVLAVGSRANVLQTFEDKPMNFDAWDIDIYYQEKMREISECSEIVVEEQGPLRGTLRMVWKFGDSTIIQRLRVYAASPRIDFETSVDWYEQQVLLKVAFPVDIRSTRATYEIQYGNVERPTHWNTSWDWARFEVSGHKWVDLSEGNYGVALLNDCKYGYDIKDNVMRMTLIKSAVRPDALADKGRHEFTYSLLPHRGDWREGDVSRHAHELNIPLLAQFVPARVQPADLPPAFSFAQVDAEHVILDTIKKAENGDGWTIRLFEFQQKRRKNVTINFGKHLVKAVECNLMEEEEQPAAWAKNQLHFEIKPYEIKTFKIWFA
jgi:alpha-mannosidase